MADEPAGATTLGDPPRSPFAQRLREVVDEFGSASALAKAIRRSEGAVRKWLRGESEPNVSYLRAICEVTHTRIEWLVTGVGHRKEEPLVTAGEPAPGRPPSGRPPLNAALLEATMAALEEELDRAGLVLSQEKRAALLVTLYELFRDRAELDRDAVARLVRLAR